MPQSADAVSSTLKPDTFVQVHQPVPGFWRAATFSILPIVFLAIVLLLLPWNRQARVSSPAFASPGSGRLQVFRLYFGDPSELREALSPPSAYDVLGVDLKEQFVALLITGEDAEVLRNRGYRLDLDAGKSGPKLLSWSTDYYGYDRMATELTGLAANYSSLARLYDLGPAWIATNGGAIRRLWALRISRGQIAKPQVLFVADEHAREIATVEIGMRLAKYLLQGYGSDPEATFLVDNRDIWIVPMVNPDGHVLVEGGSSMKRKNANTDNGSCSEPYWGVDLNRNFPYRWGFAGADQYPCGETFLGPAAGSEPETQAIMRLINDNSFRFLMDYHSFGNLILWPWGYQYDDSTLDPRLAATGAKLSRLTAQSGGTQTYSPIQGSQLYLTSGNLLDWAYANKNVLAFTTEIGSSGDWFDPPYARVDALWAENKPPALYLLNIADDPDRIYGPGAMGARVSADLIGLTGTITLTATISDLDNGGQNVTAAEIFVDTMGANGTGAPMSPADGAFDSPAEVVQATIPASALGMGRHLLLARGRDGAGNWGSLTMAFVQVSGASTTYFPLIRRGLDGVAP